MFKSLLFPTPVTRFDEVYPQREEEQVEGWVGRLGRVLMGAAQRRFKRRAGRVFSITAAVAQHEAAMRVLDAGGLREQARELTRQLRRNGLQDPLVAQTFALVREAADRVLGMRHFDVQLVGGWVLVGGMVAEMETGEGKTLTATLPACTAALAGRAVHIITVNDYLVLRDHALMQPLYAALGITSAAVTAEMSHEARQLAYACDVVYCTNKTVVFDYLRDRIVLGSRADSLHLKLEKTYGGPVRVRRLLLRGLSFAIVDEADSVLADEAGTPLIISAEVKSTGDSPVPRQAIDFAAQLVEGEHYRLLRGERRIEMLEAGHQRVLDLCQSLSGVWRITLRREDIIQQALMALHLYVRDEHYLVRDGLVQVVDEYTGRVMADRSWGQGLHQMIEVKEGCKRTPRKETLARISYQRFFRRYQHLSGMSGTVSEVAGELAAIYDLAVFKVPTHQPGRRVYQPDEVRVSQPEKWQRIVARIQAHHQRGAPVLVGTRSVAASEGLSALLTAQGLAHTVLNAKQDGGEAEIVAQAGQVGCITIATNMAGRGTDIQIAPEALALGGLHVILSERNEAGRIDRQIAGRCARQGDPGSVEAILAMDDALVVPLADGLLSRWLVKGLGQRPALTQALRAKWIRAVQRRLERRQSKMRRGLMKSDRQMGDMLSFSGRAE
jgi:preprotein translocase subunit SecA